MHSFERYILRALRLYYTSATHNFPEIVLGREPVFIRTLGSNSGGVHLWTMRLHTGKSHPRALVVGRPLHLLYMRHRSKELLQ